MSWFSIILSFLVGFFVGKFWNILREAFGKIQKEMQANNQVPQQQIKENQVYAQPTRNNK